MRHRHLPFALALLAACQSATTDEADDTDESDALDPGPALVAGAPLAGAAEGTLKLPVGTPLAGFTSRCGCLGGTSRQDDRDSHYALAFMESTGVHIRPTIKALWIENGDRHLVLTKTDTIYSHDQLVEALTEELERRTGLELGGQVTHTANHNHSSYGTFSQHTGLFLGHDKFYRENFERFVQQLADVAEEAYEARVPAALGYGLAKDWDPDDRVYSDRRGVNDDLVLFDDLGPEQGKKDPYLTFIRVDEADAPDRPIANVFSWGMHPYVFGEDSPLATADATALIEAEVSESFGDIGRPVVSMFVPGSSGDASVRGSDDGWARMETVGLYARDAILDLREITPTSSAPLTIESQARSIPLSHDDIRVTRGGTVDWYFAPYVPDESFVPDERVFDENGELISPVDEFNTEYGAVFCGGAPLFPVGGLPTDVMPYESCVKIELMTALLDAFFRLEDSQVELPLDGLVQTYSAAAMLGNLPVLRADGTEVEAPVLLSFHPGEAVHFYTEMWKHRVRDELGIEDTMVIGYAMDHHGYLLPMEDWVRREYEADITFWGPFGGDYILEQTLETAKVTLTDTFEPTPANRGPYQYPEWPLEQNQPDLTPTAGTRIESGDVEPCDLEDNDPTRPCYENGTRLWVPRGFELDLDVPDVVPRVQGIVQLAWIGGDPGVDDPRVTLEREVSEGVWEPVRTPGGRVVNEDHHDFGLGHTQDPLFPASAQQTHTWWAVWQAVSHLGARVDLPLGTYRIVVDGKKYAGGATTWPWPTETYRVESEPFEIESAELSFARGEGNLEVWIEAPQRGGFRLIDLEGNSQGANPLRGELTVEITDADGILTTQTVPAGTPVGGRTTIAAPASARRVTVTDAHGNTGTWIQGE